MREKVRRRVLERWESGSFEQGRCELLMSPQKLY